jgi:hypothetical protein
MPEIKKTVVAFDEKDLIALERIITDVMKRKRCIF